MGNSKKLILLSGKKRHGKDTVASMMKQIDPSIKILAFATPLKQIVAATLNIPMPILEEYKNDGFVCMHGIPLEDQTNADFMAQSYRDILQRFGTEAMKPVFGNEVWSMLAVKRINELFVYTDTIVITDWRFTVEYEYLVENLSNSIEIKTLRVERPSIEANDQHSSEIALDDFPFDLTMVNNGTLEELKAGVERYLNTLSKLQTYQCTKQVKAEPMTRFKAQMLRLVRDESIEDEHGYYVIYDSGYESWSPKEDFESGYRLLGDINV